MKTRSNQNRAIIAIPLTVLVLILGPASAQDQPPVLPLSVLTLQFSAAPNTPPTFDPAQETVVFKVSPVGTVTGDLEGNFTQRITQVGPGVDDPINPVNMASPVATFFTIETEEGTIEGYYEGAFYSPEDIYPDVISRQHGQVLSVTAAYADLYLADVYYDGIVDFEEVDGAQIGLGDSGKLIIAPR